MKGLKTFQCTALASKNAKYISKCALKPTNGQKPINLETLDRLL